ncbi:type II toxin-antitoxin system death-on-curing family toxin [Candidatus Sumerlaeota bacterium]
MSPTFLSLAELLEIHRDQLERYGGEPGVRDMNTLRSALAMPAAGVYDRYLHDDIREMAAAYLFHIVQDHPFIDGNKRTGAVAALVFLALNGVDVRVDEDALEEMVRAVAEGQLRKGDVADFFRHGSS